MSVDPDRHMAMLLQKQFDLEFTVDHPPDNLTYQNHKKSQKKPDNTKSLTDPSWELVDPTPNIYVLFVQFNERFFWNKLLAVSVSWSKRMTTCAGICSYQGRGGLCQITLSEPLLKLRPRKDLIETLLHEMIHAFLFVTHNNRDRDGHGPEFHKHMYRINTEAGTRITVYHNFHDEVRLYQQHWWRCDGPCQKRPPYFGMVRRAMNRAPGPYDRWFAEHQRTCGGTYIKVKEPEKNNKSKTVASKTNTIVSKISSPKKVTSPKKVLSPGNTPDIRNFLPVISTAIKNDKVNKNLFGDNCMGTKNKNGTVVLNPKSRSSANDSDTIAPIASTSSSNIVGFSDVDQNKSKNNIEVFAGTGRKLNGSTESNQQTSSGNADYSIVRNHWLNKFSNNTQNQETSKLKRKSLEIPSPVRKKIKVETVTSSDISCPNCNANVPAAEINSHLDTCLSADDSIKSEFSNDSLKMVECPVCKTMIDESDLNTHLDECLAADATKEDTISFDKIFSNNDKPISPEIPPKFDLTHCEICDNLIDSEEFAAHAQDCLNKCYDEIEKKYNLENPGTPSDLVQCLVCNKSVLKNDLNMHLEECMGTVFDKDNFTADDNNTKRTEDDKTYNCPICMACIDETNMNSHIDECLNKAASNDDMFLTD